MDSPFYVENFRAPLGITTTQAKNLLKAGEDAGVLKREIQYMCPGCLRGLLALAPGEAEPEEVECEVCEADERPYTFKTADLEKADRFTFSEPSPGSPA